MELFVWCFLNIKHEIDGENYTTVARGKVIKELEKDYLVDYTEYAKIHKYAGNYSAILSDKDGCFKSQYGSY